MTGIRIVVDNNTIGSGLAELSRRLADLRPFYLDIGEDLLNSTRARFLSQLAPDGTAWAALSPYYLSSRQKKASAFPNAINRRSGELFRTLTKQATSDQLQIGSDLEYAEYPQFGSKARVQGRQIQRRYKGRRDGVEKLSVYFRGEHSREVSARPYLGVSATDIDGIGDALAEYLAGG